MIFGNLVGLKVPDICLIGEEKPRVNFTQEIFPDRGSIPGPQRDSRACYRLLHSDGLIIIIMCSAQGQVLHCKLRPPGCNSTQSQVSHCKLRNLGSSFTRDE